MSVLVVQSFHTLVRKPGNAQLSATAIQWWAPTASYTSVDLGVPAQAAVHRPGSEEWLWENGAGRSGGSKYGDQTKAQTEERSQETAEVDQRTAECA